MQNAELWRQTIRDDRDSGTDLSVKPDEKTTAVPAGPCYDKAQIGQLHRTVPGRQGPDAVAYSSDRGQVGLWPLVLSLNASGQPVPLDWVRLADRARRPVSRRYASSGAFG